MILLIVRHEASKLARLMNNFVTLNATFHFYKFKNFWMKNNYDQINGAFRRFYRGAKLFWRELCTSIIIP